MFVGASGAGKTCLVREGLHTLENESHTVVEMAFNFCTDSKRLQDQLEAVLERKTGSVLAPPGAKRLVCFLDDLNTCAVDKYGTQQPVAFLRQHLDYGFWYDRKKLAANEVQQVQYLASMTVQQVQYLASMTVTTGSQTIDPRLQASFATFTIPAPDETQTAHIYSSILSEHFSTFDAAVAKVASGPVLNAILNLHRSVAEGFTQTQTKFHYTFSMRQTSAVVQ
ncbi:P-loop containing dynein motor region D3-domain-containing protein, partial [Baffinella frigidus]